MRIPLNPLGILLGHVLPAAVLAFLFYDVLSVVHPLLEPKHVDMWSVYAAWLLGMVLTSSMYALVLLRMGKSVHFLYGIAVFLIYVPFLYGSMDNFSDFLPADIPRWMVPDDIELYAIRLLSIPLGHALFVLVAASLPEGSRGQPLRDLLIAVAIPLLCYLFVQVVEPWRWDIDFEEHLWVVLGVTMVVAFLFFVFRGIAALVVRAGPGSKVLGWILRSIVALVLPLMGLAVNNGLLSDWREVHGVFGDLSHWGFYLIAVLNAAVVLWPSSGNVRVRFLQFTLRSIGFSYVIYFFVLFLPLLPVSIVAVIAIGIGFLLLAPVLLFIVQGMQLMQDIRFLSVHRSRGSVFFIMVAALAVLPGIITARYIHHKLVLQAALDHVYHADPLAEEVDRIDTTALRGVLDHIEGNKDRTWSGGNTPFLTPYYNRIVLDNLALSEAKLADLRTIFLDAPPREEVSTRWVQPPRAVLDTAWTKSTFDTEQQAWRTWVDLRMHDPGESQSEYVTTFDLPEGAWICDDYLMIEGEKVKGILAEKKAAEWVYRQIVNVRRDPSLTRYVAPGRVQVRVFPFAAAEQREAGFEVLHKEPFTLTIDSTLLVLGDTSHAAPTAPIVTADGSSTYVSSALKRTLTPVRRAKEFHFIVNGSESARGDRELMIGSIEAFLHDRKIDPSTAVLHIADAYHEQVRWSEQAAERLRTHAGDGGFFSDRAVRSIITASCGNAHNRTPMIVFVASMPLYYGGAGVWLEDLDDLAACLPEGAVFYDLGGSGSASSHPFSDPGRSLNTEPETFERPDVLPWPSATAPVAYLPDNDKPSIVVNKSSASVGYSERRWIDALHLEGGWRTHQLDPSGGARRWRELVRGSFQAQVMTPATAWMCLEDDAQRNALLKKQEEVLNADQALDADDEDITAMSEPDFLWLLVPVLGWFLLRRRYT
ncbi:MAG: MSEP-CTERM sorting domain-containing protein [Flavobacteriales bacterium]|nr:MSEP-CTERM sorting domain-containing protein [Flavobacteriales bacterium]